MVKTETLQKFNPAVAWLILHGSNARLTDLLRLTFFDLVNRKVLKITDEEYGPRGDNEPPTMAFVQVGEAFHNYQPLPHEEAFTHFFRSNPEAKMMIKTMVKLARKNAGSDLMFQRRVYLHGPTTYLFKRNFWHKLMGSFGLSDEGLLVQKQLEREFEDVKLAFRKNVQEDAAASHALVISLGAMALMVPGLNLAQFQASEMEFKQMRNMENPTTSTDTGTTTTGCSSGCSTGCSDVSWGNWTNEFDSGCSGHGHDGDSGCSSDSGDGGGDSGGDDSGCSSGCSGCGGGCGGD
jgi:hypothetical protein